MEGWPKVGFAHQTVSFMIYSFITLECKPINYPLQKVMDYQKMLSLGIVLYSSIYIAPLNSHGQKEALLVRLAPRKETSFKKW